MIILYPHDLGDDDREFNASATDWEIAYDAAFERIVKDKLTEGVYEFFYSLNEARQFDNIIQNILLKNGDDSELLEGLRELVRQAVSKRVQSLAQDIVGTI
jgi:hypothetical protein